MLRSSFGGECACPQHLRDVGPAQHLAMPCMCAVRRRGGEAGMPADGGMGGPSGPLARFLRAEKFDVHKAEKRLRAHAAWRASYIPDGRISEAG